FVSGFCTCSISCPNPGISVATPHSIGRTSRISATSESPGAAPRTATGPVARLCAPHRDRAGRAVEAREVDLGDEVVLAPDLAREAVVRLEGDDVAGLDLQHRLEVGPERPDHLVTRQEMLLRHPAAQPPRPRPRPGPRRAAAPGEASPRAR